MNKKAGTTKDAADKPVRRIQRKTRKHCSSGETIRIVLAALRGEEALLAPAGSCIVTATTPNPPHVSHCF